MKHRRNPRKRGKTYLTGRAIRKEREKLGLLQKEAAKLCKMSQSYLSHLERFGDKTIGWDGAKRLVSLFGKAGKELAKKRGRKPRRAKPRGR